MHNLIGFSIETLPYREVKFFGKPALIQRKKNLKQDRVSEGYSVKVQKLLARCNAKEIQYR